MAMVNERFLLAAERLADLRGALSVNNEGIVTDISNEIDNSIVDELGGFKYKRKDVLKLVEPRRNWVWCTRAEAEVNNGGLWQYLYNSGDQLADAIEGFRYFAQPNFVELFERARSLVPSTLDLDKSKARNRWLTDNPDTCPVSFEALDDAFFSDACHQGSTQPERLAWTAKNPIAFFKGQGR